MPKLKKHPESTPNEQEDPLDAIALPLRKALTSALASHEADPGNASLLKQTVALATEIRKFEMSKLKRLQAIDLRLVMAWLRAQDSELQGKVLRDLQSMASKKGTVLS